MKASAQYTLSTCFWTILRLIAPIIPHVTEELYQDIFKSQYKQESIHTTTMPKSHHLDSIKIDEIIKIISDVRGYKTSNKLSLGTDVKKIRVAWPQSLLDLVKIYELDVLGVTKSETIDYNIADAYTIEIIL